MELATKSYNLYSTTNLFPHPNLQAGMCKTIKTLLHYFFSLFPINFYEDDVSGFQQNEVDKFRHADDAEPKE